jgi:tetratricopeptide (TPR) repeat protein
MYDTLDEKARLRRQMSEEAITLAMKGQWKEAVAINQSIIDAIPTEVDAYNRLGKAFMELGDLAQAKNAYRNALELDHNNSIAKKNLNRLEQMEVTKVKIKDTHPKATPDLFIGEVGKAGVVNLTRLASPPVLAKIMAGDKINLKVSGHHLVAENEQGEYLGAVDNQLGFRLAKLMNGGNKYAAAVVSLDTNKVRVIIREVFQDPGQAGRLSFPAKALEDFQPHVKDTLLRHGETDEEYPEEEGEGDEAELEEGEVLPDGFSIFEAGVYMDDMADSEMLDEET